MKNKNRLHNCLLIQRTIKLEIIKPATFPAGDPFLHTALELVPCATPHIAKQAV